MSDRIQNLVDLGKLVREPAGDEEVAGLFANALQAFEDACIPAMSLGGRLVRAYDAGRLAATAVVRSRDLRVRASNHHEVTLAVAQSMGSQELRIALRELDAIRPLRSDAEYGWKTSASASDAERTVDVVGRLLRHAAQNLREHRPALSPRIPLPD